MSLWNDFMGGLKNRLLEFYVGDREQTYVRWGSVEGKFQLLFELLRALKSRKECRDVCATLTELMPVLEKQKFHYESDNIFFNRVRSSMLDLWYLLLKCVQQWSSATLAPAPPKDSAILDQAATVAASAAATPLSTSPSDVLPQANKPIQSPLNLNDAVTFYHAISYIMRRREFDPTFLNLDGDNQLNCSLEDRHVAYRYRLLLFKTQAYVQRAIQWQMHSNKAPSNATYSFYARVLAINCFRVPKVVRHISNAVALTESQLSTLQLPSILLEELDFLDDADAMVPVIVPATSTATSTTTTSSTPGSSPSSTTPGSSSNSSNSTSPSTASSISGSGSSNGASSNHVHHVPSSAGSNGITPGSPPVTSSSVSLSVSPSSGAAFGLPSPSRTRDPHFFELARSLAQYPQLFQWNQYHSALLMWKSDNEDERLQSLGSEWQNEIKKLDILFFLFLHEWIQHVLFMVDFKFDSMQWQGIPGYKQFLASFIFAMKRQPRMGKALLDCSCSFLLTNPSLVNFYIMFAFSKTNVYDVLAVLETVAHLEVWLTTFEEWGMVLPPNFDYSFFCRGIDIMFQSEHHQVMHRALKIIYSFAEIFVGEARKALFIDLLLTKYFYQLFLHWDPNIRNAYHQLIAFKMIRLKRSQLAGEGLLDADARRQRSGDGNPSMQESETIIDTLIYGKIESYLRILEDQLTDKTLQRYPAHLEVYAKLALTEYKSYMNMYTKWEREGGEIPRLVTLSNYKDMQGGGGM